MTDFVLVHGAWHGGWCYARVAEWLRGRGHRVFTPTLTGLGERAHLFGGQVNLSTHIADVVNVIRWEGLDRVVLLGHSYGGMVVTGAADAVHDKVATLAYLDAFVPAGNQSVFDLAPPEITRLQMEAASAHGGYAIPPTPAAAFNLNEADRAWVDALCTPQPLACMNERLKLSGGVHRIRNKAFILATGWANGRGFRRWYDQVRDLPGWTRFELACGHDAMIDMPEGLAAILASIAG